METLIHPAATEREEEVALRAVRMLRSRHGMGVGEISMRLDLPEAAVRRALAPLIDRGEVELLRPIGYQGGDHDFLALPRPEGYPWEA